MQDLGTLGGPQSQGSGINASGQVVGTAGLPDNSGHAFLWDSSSGMQDLGTLGDKNSFGVAINDFGQVVGDSYPLNQPVHAFLWDSNNGMQDLNTLIPPDSGWTLETGYDINDAGQIVGQGRNPDGQEHGFLLTPDGGGAPRGRMKSSAAIDPAVITVPTPLATHGTAGVPSDAPLFPNAQAGPLLPEAAPPVTAESALPTRAGLNPPRASADRQAQDVLFAGDATASPSLEWPDGLNATALDALAETTARV
jgi:probable HAF family extracellular repeat protein